MVKRIICCTLGLLLLVAASLKLYGMNITPFAQYGRFLSPTVQFLAVEWEIGLASLAFGSADAALARLRGERVSIQPRLVDIGAGQPGQVLETAVEVVNRTDKPLTILGGSSDCSCVTTKDLPLALAPGEAHRVSVQVRLPGNSGFFNRKAYFWTDCEGARRVVFGLTGQINPAEQTSAAAAAKE